jgi:hypothetical protein
MGEINLLPHRAGHLALSAGSKLGPEFFHKTKKILDIFIHLILFDYILHLHVRGQPLKWKAYQLTVSCGCLFLYVEVAILLPRFF